MICFGKLKETLITNVKEIHELWSVVHNSPVGVLSNDETSLTTGRKKKMINQIISVAFQLLVGVDKIVPYFVGLPVIQ
jgi:hypothetical protein